MGEHVYIANMWDLSAFDACTDDFYRHGYIVFDDLDWETLRKTAKSWFGGQRDFTVCDKYRQKKRIKGGIPCIYLCNPDDFSSDLLEFVRGDWGQKNIRTVRIDTPLFEEPSITVTNEFSRLHNPYPI